MNEKSIAARVRRFASRVTGGADAERLAALARALRANTEAQSAGLQSVQSELVRLTDRAANQAEKELEALREVREAVQNLGDRFAKHEDPLFAAGRRFLRRDLEKVAGGSRPIIVGPWTGEVGFELLYWIPFVRWVCAEFAIDPRRLLVISRGGVASWYGVPQDQYEDIFRIVTPDEFRAATNAEHSSLKQRDIGSLDQRILETVTRQRGWRDPRVLHPGAMFRAFKQYWADEVGYARIVEFTKYSLMDPPLASRPPGLPSEYVAVRFYFRRSFPDRPRVRAFAKTFVQQLARTVPVVVLTSGVRVDDHHDWTDVGGHGVTVCGDVPAERNLEVQSAVIGGARAFVGTYGGLSYLAPLYRVPSLAFYWRRRFDLHHLDAAQRAFDEIDAASLTMVDASQADLIGSAFQSLQARPAENATESR